MRLMSIALVATSVMGGCAAYKTPDNLEPVAEGRAYQAQYRSKDVARARDERNARSIALNAERCAVAPTRAGSPSPADPELLTSGDLVDVTVGTDEVFTGAFEVSRDGTLKLPHLSAISAAGRQAEALQDEIASRLVSEGYYRRAPRVSVRVVDFAAARVHVSGAVFAPGTFVIGGVAGDERDTIRQAALGAAGEGRTFSVALRAAGGIRPDADLSAVQLTRDGQTTIIDLTGAVNGSAFSDMMLIGGDAIRVPSRGCFQEALMVPSAVSPPGITVYMSNLTQPAASNASSAIGKETREMPYGSRFLQAAVKMNCMGGAKATNADRYAVLFSRNPVTGQSLVIERRLEDLLRRADRDDLDPYLLPGDAIACYDSAVTSITEVAKSVAIVLGTGILLAL